MARHGFTLVEMMVSVGVLVLLLGMVGLIFGMATDASSKATASNQLMGRLRTLEQQIRRDLAGLQKDRFIGIWYQLTNIGDNANPFYVRTDRLVFFASGDHSSSLQCINRFGGPGTGNTGQIMSCADTSTTLFPEPLRSGVARLFYGHSIDTLGATTPPLNRTQPFAIDPWEPAKQWSLARRQKLYVADVRNLGAYVTALGNNPDSYDFTEFETTRKRNTEQPATVDDLHNFGPLQFKSDVAYFANAGVFDERPAWSWIRRPRIDANPAAAQPVGTHMYFLPYCAEFKVQRWEDRNPVIDVQGAAGWPAARWFPEEDRDADGLVNESIVDSDFLLMASGLGPTGLSSPPSPWNWNQNVKEYFNGPRPRFNDTAAFQYRLGVAPNDRVALEGFDSPQGPWLFRAEDRVPEALKITVRLFDRNERVGESGRQFTVTVNIR